MAGLGGAAAEASTRGFENLTGAIRESRTGRSASDPVRENGNGGKDG